MLQARSSVHFCLALAFVYFPAAAQAQVQGPVQVQTPAPTQSLAPRPLIQIALLLDTSTSMDGLIVQAQAQLWKVVNEFAYARREGAVPDLQVALYEYGKSTLPAASGFLRRILPLTTDLDKVSEELFKLTAKAPNPGSEEYCGWAIQAAASELAWSFSNNDLKTIFIAGNEPFNQGPIEFHQACKAAATRGICINTIYCGPEAQGIATFWKDGAILADGKFLSIDHNRLVVDASAPQDKEITRLGIELNRTYVPFGKAGEVSRQRQSIQDSNSESLGSSNSSQRAVSKASLNYRNSNWDLVDAYNEKTIQLDKLKPEELPEALRKMSPAEIKTYLEGKLKERDALRRQIQTLDGEKKKFLTEEQKKSDVQGVRNLDKAIITVLKEQADKKQFSLKEPQSQQQGQEKVQGQEKGQQQAQPQPQQQGQPQSQPQGQQQPQVQIPPQLNCKRQVGQDAEGAGSGASDPS